MEQGPHSCSELRPFIAPIGPLRASFTGESSNCHPPVSHSSVTVLLATARGLKGTFSPLLGKSIFNRQKATWLNFTQ